MKKILLVVSAIVLIGCDSPVENNAMSNGNNGGDPVEYRYEYEFKNDRNKDVSIVFCREFLIKGRVTDSKGKGYKVDSTLTTFESVFVPMDSIVSIGSDKDTLLMSPQYLLDIADGRFRAIEYGEGLRKLSNDEY
jgi:hypothetical protein